MDVRKDVWQKIWALDSYCSTWEKDNRIIWKCLCECGRTAYVDTHSLTTGNTKSCGCKKYGGRRTHGEAASQTRLYRIWAAMKLRCNNKNNIGFHRYGGKGIKVCDEWNTFEVFRDWAMSNGYSDELTIDRIDSNGDYVPENCRWVSYKVQINLLGWDTENAVSTPTRGRCCVE